MNQFALTLLLVALHVHPSNGFSVNNPYKTSTTTGVNGRLQHIATSPTRVTNNVIESLAGRDAAVAATAGRKFYLQPVFARKKKAPEPEEYSDDDGYDEHQVYAQAEDDDDDEEEIVEEEEEEEYEYEEVEEDDDVEEDEEEYEYVEVEGEYLQEEEEGEEYDEELEGGNTEPIPLQDDPDDPNYNMQKKLIEETIARREAWKVFQENVEGPESPTFLRDSFQEFVNEQFEKAELDEKLVEKYAKKLRVSEKEAEEAIREEMERTADMSLTDKKAEFLTQLGSDAKAFPDNDDPIMPNGIKNEDLVQLQNALESLVGTIKGYEDGSLIDNKQAIIRPQYELGKLDSDTLDEINLCLNASATDANGLEYGESIKNEDPLRWLLYDLDFDVANLMLAACKHNPEAPLILNHWMPQLCAYRRYAEIRENNFQFSWEDCENADLDELKRYYQGLGYDEIPTFTPKETNIVELETQYDQEDMTMAAFENWMNEVYVEEGEDLYFDDEDFQPENNVFDENYGLADSDQVVTFKSELQDFYAEHRNETKEWKEKYVRQTNYTDVEDKEGAEQFRGHLVVACCGSEKDLELAEKITQRMNDEFDKQLYVETRVYSHARQEDNLYEIWLESYDIELLHSRRGALYNAKQWFGPADVDDEQLDNIVERIRYMISDEARYSYDLHEFVNDV